MNPLNYATLEASQRLVEAGIVLEMEAMWLYDGEEWVLTERYDAKQSEYLYPAPSMAEVWRELPERIETENASYLKQIWEHNGLTYCSYMNHDNDSLDEVPGNTNSTDALIDLLIWVRGQKGKEEYG